MTKKSQALALLQSLRGRKTRRTSLELNNHTQKEWYHDDEPSSNFRDWHEPWLDNPITPDVIKQHRHDVNTLRRAKSVSLSPVSAERPRRSREFLVDQVMAEHVWAGCKSDPEKKFLRRRLIDVGIVDRYHLK